MERIPEEDVSEVAPEIGVPIAERLSFVTNEELSGMYTEFFDEGVTRTTGKRRPS